MTSVTEKGTPRAKAKKTESTKVKKQMKNMFLFFKTKQKNFSKYTEYSNIESSLSFHLGRVKRICVFRAFRHDKF